MKTKKTKETSASLAESTPPNEAGTSQFSTPHTGVPNIAEPNKPEAAGPATTQPTVTPESENAARRTLQRKQTEYELEAYDKWDIWELKQHVSLGASNLIRDLKQCLRMYAAMVVDSGAWTEEESI